MTGDARKLLGGYATGTLTAEEQNVLFQAALSDQELFNALGDEQVLRNYLDDREFRGQLLDALEPPAPKVRNLEPLGWLFAGAVAACSLVIFSMALQPPRSTVAANKPPVFTPPPPPAVPKPLAVVAMDPPPPLIRQTEPEPPLAAVTRIKPAAAAPVRRMTVAVLDFHSEPRKPEVGQSVSNLVSEKLEADNVYFVIKRNAVQSALPPNSAPVDSASAARIGRQLGADAVVLGQVNEPAVLPAFPTSTARMGKAAVSASLIDSATGKKLRDVRAGPALENLQAAARAIGTALENDGKVTDVNAAILTIDIGTKSGIKRGDRLTISRDGKAVGSLVITTPAETFSVGRYTGSEVKIGDRAAIH